MSPNTSRYHALDSLRAVMMLLGIYLHVTVAYATVGGWPYKQAQLTDALNWSLGLIHIFRMPLFYVMAGFFGALLYDRRGLRGFLDNRMKRVLLPFIGGWLILFPMVIGIIVARKAGFAAVIPYMTSRAPLMFAHPMHLWFLEYLVLLYALGALAVKLTPQRVSDAIAKVFGKLVVKWWAPFVFAIPSFLALLPMQYAGLEDPPGFLPVPRIFFAYVIPFAFGWLLYPLRHSLIEIFRAPWTRLAVVVVPLVFYLGFLKVKVPAAVSFFADRALHSIVLWFLIFGVTGLFLRYLSGHSYAMRYASDSSYFLYLAHMPVIMVLQIALEPLPWPPLAKIPVVLAITTPILVVMYHYLVRPTWIGAALNGRRYPISGQTAAMEASPA